MLGIGYKLMCHLLNMKKKKRLETRKEVQERIEKKETIEKKDFSKLLKKAVQPSSKRPV